MKGGAWKYYDYKKENSRYATKYIPNTGIDYPEKKNNTFSALVLLHQ